MVMPNKLKEIQLEMDAYRRNWGRYADRIDLSPEAYAAILTSVYVDAGLPPARLQKEGLDTLYYMKVAVDMFMAKGNFRIWSSDEETGPVYAPFGDNND